MDQADKKIGDWILGVRHELIEYGVNVVYLALVLAAFTVHQRLVLAAHDITYTNYWFALIEALILGKVVMIGGILRLGRGLEDKPLIYPTLYKTVVFTIFVAVFEVIEYAIKGLVAGEGIAGGLAEFAEKGFHLILADNLVVLIALIPFFAVKELGRVFGREKIAALFFRPRDPQ
ncbi:MAG: hypothetical protein LJE70_05665 [Chromatiaceae bacterium]|nr:hypothetical protein [Chromatiaceae bacterium]